MTKTSATTAATTAATPASNTVDLEEPIRHGAELITSVELRKPRAGELRGVALGDLLNLKVDAMRIVLPRITSPGLLAQDVDNLTLPDLMQFGEKLTGFFLTTAQREQLSLPA